MKKILAIGGSNSKASINKQLATYAAQQLNGTATEVVDLNDYDIPIYGIDHETEKGFPSEALRLNELFDTADGFVVSLAEHNGSYAVAFKNVTDWLSRINREVWRNKPMLLMATSPGGRGGATVLEAAKGSYPHAAAQVVGTFSLPKFHENFSADGITDENLRESLAENIQALQEAL